MKKTYIIALSFLLILTIGIAINDYAKQYNLIVAEGSTPNPGHPIDQIDGLQSIIDDINNTIGGLGVIGEGGSGDVNGDGEVTTADAFLIHKYLEGTTTFTSEQKLIADVDGDGVITMSDALIATRIGYGYTKDESIKYVYSKVGPVDANLYKIDYNTDIGGDLDVNGNLNVSGGIHVGGGSGDVNGDGEASVLDSVLILRYLDGLETFTPEQKLIADVDGNGIVTSVDAQVILAMRVYISKEEAIRIAYSTVGFRDDNSYRILHNTKIGGNLDVNGNLNVSGGIRVEGGSGDVSGDGELGSLDGVLILRYLDGLETFTPEQKSAADYDGNGIITYEDARAISFTLVGDSKEQAIRRAQRGVFVSGIIDESCNSLMEGYMRYNSSAKVMQYCNGSVWTNL